MSDGERIMIVGLLNGVFEDTHLLEYPRAHEQQDTRL